MTKAMEEARAILKDINVHPITHAPRLLDRIATALAARDAEIERTQTDEREACIKAAVAYCWERYKGREPMNLSSPAVFTSHEWQKIEEHIRHARTAGDQP